MDQMLIDARVRYHKPVQEQHCDFCRKAAFPTQALFVDHIGDHVKEISLSSIRHSLNISTQQSIYVRFGGVLAKLLNRYKHFRRRFMPSHAIERQMQITILSGCNAHGVSYYAGLDTQSDYNMISRKVVNQQHLKPKKDRIQIEALPSRFEVDEYVDLTWQVHGMRHNVQRDCFRVYPGRIAGGYDMLVGHVTMERLKVRLHREGSALPLQDSRRGS